MFERRTFLGSQTGRAEARFLILPVPVGRARYGPMAIIDASYRIPRGPFAVHTLPPTVEPGPVEGRFVIALGGDRTITERLVPPGAALVRIGGSAKIDAGAKKVYLSVDLAALDPSVIPAVESPCPGGLGWRETMDRIRGIFARKNVVGADVVGLCPLPDSAVSEFAAARLVCEIMNLSSGSGLSGRKR